jgi:hypothetical protein
MIERNVGNVERVLRLMAGLALLGWACSRSGMTGIDWFVMLISVALIFNGVFQRCYLWFVLDINTHQKTMDSTSTPVCQ